MKHVIRDTPEYDNREIIVEWWLEIDTDGGLVLKAKRSGLIQSILGVNRDCVHGIYPNAITHDNNK